MIVDVSTTITVFAAITVVVIFWMERRDRRADRRATDRALKANQVMIDAQGQHLAELEMRLTQLEARS